MRFLLFSLTLFLVNLNAKAQTPFFPQYNVETEKWSYIDTSGNAILAITLANIDDLHPFSDGLAAALDGSTQLWGFINTSGNWVIQPKYAAAQDFLDSYAIVRKPCEADCNTSTEGVLSSDISYVIDTKGNVVLTDKSQHADSQTRFFLDKNLGEGLFRIIFGYGENDMKNVVNLKGELLCKTYSIFTAGEIEYEADLKAFKCQNIFYNSKGAKVLDLSKYSFVNPFSEGYAWVSQEQEINGEPVTMNILIDLKGKEILRFNNNKVSYPQPVENGAFIHSDAENNTYRFILTEKRSVPYTAPESEENSGLVTGKKEKNGLRYI
ncbi:MAG: WG repeat-containing protein, partial [Bacteroidia bacterium]